MPPSRAPRRRAEPTGASRELIQAVLTASRALFAVAARSLGYVADDVTLAQYRVLVELAARGPQRPADIASALAVDRSTTTRMCDRLVRKHLVDRRRTSADRRAVRMSLTPAGRELVEQVTARRRREVARIVRGLPADECQPMVDALRAFSDAAGQVPEQDWALGWGLEL